MALFNTITEVKQHLPINITFSFDLIRPYLKEAEHRWLLPMVGRDQLDDLDNATEGSKAEALRYHCRQAVANLAYYLYIPVGMVQVSSSGIHVASNENIKSPFQWQIHMLQDSFLKNGHDNLEQVLCYLEDNEPDFPLWGNDPAFTRNRAHFINRATDFSALYNIHNSRLVFSALLPVIGKVEDFFIQSVVCSPFYTYLKNKIADMEAFTGPEQAALALIRKAVAHLAIAQGIESYAIRFEAHGVQVFGLATNQGGHKAEAATDNRLAAIKQTAQADGQTYLSMLKNLLNANPADFPLYASSPCYDAGPSNPGSIEINNNKTNGFYAL